MYHGFSNKTLLIRNAIKAVTVKKRPKFFSYRPRVALSYRPRGGRRRGRAAAMAGQGRPLDGPPRKKKNREKKICGPKARKFFFRVRYGRTMTKTKRLIDRPLKRPIDQMQWNQKSGRQTPTERL